MYDIKLHYTMDESRLSLPGDTKGVVMRFAPNPNGPLTLGHARGVVVNNTLSRKYGGKFILRFDDTDPRIKRPLIEAYDWIIEDMAWLDSEPDEVVIASERISLYYEHAEKLIELGKAYVCEFTRDAFKKLKDAGNECPCRRKADAAEKWAKMLSGGYEEGEAVLRIKTDTRHPDPAIREWVAFRIIKESHPRVAEKYVVWPMLDFQSAIEDHILGLTHVIRGKDLMDSEKKQRYIYDYLNWTYPEVIHWGRISIHEYGKFSTSEIAKAIQEGKYTGWDDPKLPTLRALKRRGIQPEAIRNLMLDLGLSLTDVTVSLDNLYAENRKAVDGIANRYFFVEEPVKLVIKNPPCKTFRMPLHPGNRDLGVREHALIVVDGKADISISKTDACELAKGDVVRLMGLCAVEIDSVENEVVCTKSTGKPKGKLQWVQDGIACEIVKPGGKSRGVCEKNCGKLAVDDVIQFERVGFARLDEKKHGKLVFYFAHR